VARWSGSGYREPTASFAKSASAKNPGTVLRVLVEIVRQTTHLQAFTRNYQN